MQHLSAGRVVGRVDPVAHRTLIEGKLRGGGGLPGRLRESEPVDRHTVLVEHRVDDPWREGRFTHVPVQQQPAPHLGDLRIEQDLRALRDDPLGIAEGVHHIVVEQLTEIECAGVHHRREHLFSAMATEVTQYLEPAVRGMRPVRVHHFLQRAGAVENG